jgi:uncharacterized surface protein with fasciclin (FAS1) repeats
VKRLFLKAAAAAAAGALLKACGGGGGSAGGTYQVPSSADSLLQRLRQDGRFSALLEAVNKAGLATTLDDRGASLTLFAPDNDAFDRLGVRIGLGDRNGVVSGLSAGQWRDILNFALLPQRSSLCDLTPASGQNLTKETLFTQPIGVAQLIFVRDNGNPLTIWDGIGRFLITFQASDLGAANGVMHVPSDVLLPRYVLTLSQMLRASIDSFSDFAASIASQVPELSNPGAFTVFAPFNGTFTPPLTSSQRRHHVVSGLTLKSDDFVANNGRALTPLSGAPLTLRASAGAQSTINGKSITDGDFFGSNGVIHVVAGILP